MGGQKFPGNYSIRTKKWIDCFQNNCIIFKATDEVTTRTEVVQNMDG